MTRIPARVSLPLLVGLATTTMADAPSADAQKPSTMADAHSADAQKPEQNQASDRRLLSSRVRSDDARRLPAKKKKVTPASTNRANPTHATNKCSEHMTCDVTACHKVQRCKGSASQSGSANGNGADATARPGVCIGVACLLASVVV